MLTSLVLESLPEALVLVTGLVLLSRRRQERMASGALAMLLVALVASTTIMVLWLGPILDADHDVVLGFVRWAAPIGTVLELLTVAGMLLLAASILGGHRRSEHQISVREDGPVDLGGAAR
ncbi:hypothetical protein AB0J82_10275 [Asanoa sp. NPDC049518]|uniref:hypothetical protein n=1 Tax=unclassified Asanoa TaxID=2685164 RepID=UPI0034290974